MNLLRVLIVDDDATVRIGLKSLIAWQMHGYELIGEATNGQQALEIIYRCQPHIIITDMKMPVMDGIELIRTVNAEKLPCAILALSSYNDFDLVKAALKLGAVDYLLKLELDANMLLQSLEEARNHLNFSAKDSDCSEDSRQEIQHKFFRNILSDYFTSDTEMRSQMRECGVNFGTEPVYCLILRLSDQYRFEEGTEEESAELRTNIVSVIHEIMDDCFNAYCVEGNTGSFSVFVSIRPEFLSEDAVELVINTAERLHSMLWQYLNLESILGIGYGNASLQGLRLAYNRASIAVRSKYYTDAQSVILWSEDLIAEIRDITAGERSEISQASQNLKKAVIMLQQEDVQQYISEFKTFISRAAGHRDYISYVLFELFICAQEALDWFGVPIRQTLGRSWRSHLDFLSIHNSAQAQQWIDLLSQDIMDYLCSKSSTDSQNIVAIARAYIDQNYHSNLSLTELAAEVHMNPSYLSTTMKKLLGMTYSEYLTQVRMEHAKRLLAETDQKISSVSDAVGYPDQYYFNRLFKRVNGITPGEFRKISRASTRKEDD